jgi:hypothetical protein
MTDYPNGIVKTLLPNMNAILGVRDSIGAIIEPVYLVTRTWFKDKGLTRPNNQPEGHAIDSIAQILPSPGMKNFSQDIRLKEGGAVKSGDIILTNISKQNYKISDLDGTSPSQNIQKLYMIGERMYQVINVTESYVTWSVQVRELTNQRGIKYGK